MSQTEDTKIEQTIISSNNKTFNFFLKNQRTFFICLFLVVLLLPSLYNHSLGKPILMGEESYYHLLKAQSWDINTFYYLPLQLATELFSTSLLILLPLGLAIVSLWLFFKITEKTTISDKVIFFFLLMVSLSPTFIYTFSTLSAYSFYITLVLLGFYFYQKENWQHHLSIIPFLLATFFDLYSSIFMILILACYLYLIKKDFSLQGYVIISSITIIALFNYLVLKIPFILGPFNFQMKIASLISDFGSVSGIKIFTLALALIGLTTTWKKKNFYIFYLFLPLALGAYLLNSQAIFHLSLLTSFFAATGIIKLFQRDWNLISLKKFTFLLLVLGLLFSTITYLDRVKENGPTAGDIESLYWVQQNIPQEGKVLSLPENTFIINYFSGRETLFKQKDSSSLDLTYKALASLYITELFPILEEHNISIIYVNKYMKEILPKEQGLLFLLKNERFKLVHSNEDSEVWVFGKAD